MDFLKLLEHSYKMQCRYEDLGRYEYLSEHIFDFTTYDSDMSELFGKKALEMCLSINNKTTYDYIENEENHKWYLLMVNMPFFDKKLEWGTSIRGAWWTPSNSKLYNIYSCGLYKGQVQILEFVLTMDQWCEFVKAMVEFTKLEINNE